MENSAPVFEAFSDLTPSPQFPTSDGAAPIAAISYTPDFAKAMGYFRSVIKKEEVSQRAYLLTTEVLALNPGNYTVWHWRRRCMDELGLSVEKELEWLDEVGIENEKCYQYWHHRRLVVEKLGKPYAGEEDFFDEILESDSKNYHAWTYRQWYLAHYGLIAGQLDEASKLIESNILNNSFWTFRYFVVAHMHEESKEPAALIEKEVQYALSQIEKKSTNEAAWAYLRGFLKTQKNENPSLDKSQVLYSEVPEVEKRVRKMEEGNRFALATLADIAVEKGAKEEAGQFYEKLAKLDPIRRNYYQWKKERLTPLKKEEGKGEEESKEAN